MKFLSLALLLCLGQAAFAKVVKPEPPSMMVSGSTLIEGKTVGYTVTDNGWRTSAQLTDMGNGNSFMSAVAKKQFIISFQSPATVYQTKRTTFAIEIMQDADTKCTELGKLELPGQTKDLDPKYQATLTTSATSQADFDSGVSFIVNCLVEVSIR